MFTLFNKPSDSGAPSLERASYERILTAHRNNLSRVSSHYRRENHAVSSNHLLVQILQTLPSGRNLDLVAYRDLIEDMQDELIRNFDLSSPVNVGKSRYPGIFLGEDSEEILIAISEPFSVGAFRNTWVKEPCVRFLRHPKANLNLELPDGQRKPGETGVSVILIDLPKLACQYRLWREREIRLNPEYPKTPMQFVHSHVLSNALGSFADVAYFNVLTKLFFGEPLIEVKNTHPFYLNAYFDETRDGGVELLQAFINKRLSFGQVIEGIAAIDKPTLRKALEIPSTAFTRQIKWSLVVGRLPLIRLLVLWEERAQGDYNRKDLARVRRTLKQLRSDRVLDSLGSHSLIETINREIKEDITAYL